MTIVVPSSNIKIIDFNSLFIKRIESTLLNDFESFGLIKNKSVNIRNKDVKKLIYHHVIYELCEYVLSVKGKEKIIVLYSTLVSPGRDIKHFISEADLQSFFNSFIVKIIKMLPIKIFECPCTFSKLKGDIKNKTGEGKELINSMESIIYKFDISRYTFEKARSFAKRYELTYLSNNFFQKVKSKQLILS